MQPEIFEESQIDEALDAEIRKTLVACYPHNEHIFSKTRCWRGNQPFYTVILRDGQTVCAHAAVIDRTISMDGKPIHVAGIGNVGVIPDYRGQALSHIVVNAAMQKAEQAGFDCGLLFTHRPIEKIYASIGWFEIHDQTFIRTEKDRQIQLEADRVRMFFPLKITAFPKGTVDLQGDRW